MSWSRGKRAVILALLVAGLVGSIWLWRVAAQSPQRAQFAAESLSLWGTDDSAAQVMLDYLRVPGRFPWAVSPYLNRVVKPDQVKTLINHLEEYPPETQPILIDFILNKGGFEPEELAHTLARLILLAQDKPGNSWSLLNAAYRLFAEAHATSGQHQPDNAPKPATGAAVGHETDLSGFLRWLDGIYAVLTNREAKLNLMQFVADRGRWPGKETSSIRNQVLEWLERYSREERDHGLRQEALYSLYTLGRKSALGRLVSDIEANGVAPNPRFTGNGYLLKEARQRYPNSFLARGMAAYEEVRGEPYLAIDRMAKSAQGGYEDGWLYRYGDGQYDPDREIPGWTQYLKTYSAHPGADDAAYRLGRSYEIRGDYAAALNSLYRATLLPDGDCRDDAAGRIVYILDAELTLDQLKSIPMEKLEPALAPLVRYSMAVKMLRQDDYEEAAKEMEEYLQNNRAPWSPMLDTAWRKYDLTAGIRAQMEQAKRLAGLKARWERSGDVGALYDLAAAIYHDTLTYYNHLWAGRRIEYRWVGFLESAWMNDLPPWLPRYEREMINYFHALKFFQIVVESPSAPRGLRAKALYSMGLSYVGIDQWGSEVRFLPDDIPQMVISTFERFVREYPDSSMADDAMLVVGVYRHDREYLRSILEKYPSGDRVEYVKALLADGEKLNWGARPQWVAYTVVKESDLPPEVAAWVQAHRNTAYEGVLPRGDYTYIMVSLGMRSTAGYKPMVGSIEREAEGRLKVQWWEQVPRPGEMVAQVITYPYIVVRVMGNYDRAEFLKSN